MEEAEAFDIIAISETWLQEKDEDKIKNMLVGEYKWKCIAAKKTEKKGRAKGGIIIGVRKELIPKIEEISESIMIKINIEGNDWLILCVYLNEKKVKNLKN